MMEKRENEKFARFWEPKKSNLVSLPLKVSLGVFEILYH